MLGKLRDQRANRRHPKAMSCKITIVVALIFKESGEIKQKSATGTRVAVLSIHGLVLKVLILLRLHDETHGWQSSKVGR